MITRRKSDWRKRLAVLEGEHARNESDLRVANDLWDALDGGDENNLKSVPRAIKTFRGVAIASGTGIDRLAEAVKEAFELTGQLPTRLAFDDQLFWVVSRTGRQSKSKATGWLIATISQSAE